MSGQKINSACVTSDGINILGFAEKLIPKLFPLDRRGRLYGNLGRSPWLSRCTHILPDCGGMAQPASTHKRVVRVTVPASQKEEFVCLRSISPSRARFDDSRQNARVATRSSRVSLGADWNSTNCNRNRHLLPPAQEKKRMLCAVHVQCPSRSGVSVPNDGRPEIPHPFLSLAPTHRVFSLSTIGGIPPTSSEKFSFEAEGEKSCGESSSRKKIQSKKKSVVQKISR